MGSTADKYRIQLDFTPEAFRELEKLKTELGVSSRAETVRYGMRVLRWAINTLQSGGQIFVSRNGDVSGVEFPFLPHAVPAIPLVGEDLRSEEAVSREHARRRAREAREPGRKWAGPIDSIDEQREQLRSAFEAGKQAYRETTSAPFEQGEEQK